MPKVTEDGRSTTDAQLYADGTLSRNGCSGRGSSCPRPDLVRGRPLRISARAGLFLQRHRAGWLLRGRGPGGGRLPGILILRGCINAATTLERGRGACSSSPPVQLTRRAYLLSRGAPVIWSAIANADWSLCRTDTCNPYSEKAHDPTA